ncbi:MAG: hypothetical protein COC19_06525 [SAR86 cluster bacterium]|uniref:histidine kinase n=1 Tax=SAR86 cluster bacterium TaxID=2030880 RepID=A0A2A4MIS9_9GAMM|nr:MAG: hypothetical protein COC19_06525 [SAR86 cluster bacterium]
MPQPNPYFPSQIRNVAFVYNIYRFLLSSILLIGFLGSPDATLLGKLNPALFLQTVTAYVAYGLVMIICFYLARVYVGKTSVILGSFIIDLLVISLIIYSSGGIVSGLGLLLIVVVAAGSIQLRGRMSTFLAAIATLSIIYGEVYINLQIEEVGNQFLPAGILGILLFATSLYIQTMTDRYYLSAQLADQQASNIIDLEKLNNEIIQRMRTGIVLVNQQLQIVMLNKSASTMFASELDRTEEKQEGAGKLPPLIFDQLIAWQKKPLQQPSPIALAISNRQVQVNFAYLNKQIDSNILIFLQDNRQLIQRVKQVKLASLGKLTASIAHEIRNPLGAISHASQLLKESDYLAKEDQRMTEIIVDQCKRVNLIIEETLDISRHKSTSPTKIMLKAWLSEFIDNYKASHSDCEEISLTVEPQDSYVSMTPGHLEQVLTNLVENGLRYSAKNTGKATLSLIGGVETKNEEYLPYLHIIDEGTPLDEEAAMHLFEPFHTTESEGTGLGLYISKELCEASGSQLAYRVTEAGKSCFSIYFSYPIIDVS